MIKAEFDPDGHYSISEVAKIFGVCRTTVWRWINGDKNRPPSKILVWHVLKDSTKGFLLGKDINLYITKEL